VVRRSWLASVRWVALAIGALMMRVPAVAPVHEHVHERACENQKERQIAKSMCEVLGPQQETNDDQEGRAHKKCSRCPETALGLGALMMLGVIVHGHIALLSFNH
jgi:hypothetical protein